MLSTCFRARWIVHDRPNWLRRKSTVDIHSVGKKSNEFHAYHIISHHFTSYHIISRSKQFFQRRFPQIPFYMFLHFLNLCQLFKTLLVGTSDVVPLHAMPQGTGVFAILDEECVAEPRWGTSSNAKAEDIETENSSNFRNLN